MWRIISGILDFMCVHACVCMCFCALKEKWLELSIQNLVDIQCIAVAQHGLTLSSKGQRSRSCGYQMCCRCGVCMLIRLLWFYSFNTLHYVVINNSLTHSHLFHKSFPLHPLLLHHGPHLWSKSTFSHI